MSDMAGIDFRGIPTHECPVCQSRTFKVMVVFENYDIAMWGTEAECYECGTRVTVPCPVDSPEYKVMNED